MSSPIGTPKAHGASRVVSEDPTRNMGEPYGSPFRWFPAYSPHVYRIFTTSSAVQQLLKG